MVGLDAHASGTRLMCGICGIALPRGSTRRLDRALVTSMMDTIRHRGPDGDGLFMDDGIALGHRRLSIVDVAHGAQPMSIRDGAVQIVYNGEVYNHPTLMPELQAAGVQYATHCDTETILHLYDRHGHDVATHLRGMFAFAIWDARDRTLLLTRDRLGVKPLYYVHTEDGALYFGSEIKAILAAAAVRPALNPLALPDVLANRGTAGMATLFDGVRRLLPGQRLTWRDGRLSIDSYWRLSFDAGKIDTRADRVLVDEFRERFRESVRLRLMADVPLGVFLSGGIDSAAITAVMSGLVEDPIKTFSVAFAERDANELHYARMVAARFRTDHHEVVLSPDEFFDLLPAMLWHEDEPVAHLASVPLYVVSRLAAERVKVVLTGEGSDETLGGYGRYRYTQLNAALGNGLRTLTGPLGARLGATVVNRLPRGRLRSRLLRTALTRPATLDALFHDNFAVFDRHGLAELLLPGTPAARAAGDPFATAHEVAARFDGDSVLNELLAMDIVTYLQPLLMKQDRMSMAASIESRVPFLDHLLVAFTATLPDRLKIHRGTSKVILRRAMRGLVPDEILTRRKMGFPVPLGRWFRGPYRHVLGEFVVGERASGRGILNTAVTRRLVEEHASGAANHADRLWALVNLEIWQRLWLDGEPLERIRLGREEPRVAVPT